TQLSAGRWHTCGLRPDGEVECWGNGPGGVRNQFDAATEGAPTAPPPGPYTQVAAGQWHTCALRPDGRVECWYSY
ncbi:MAG: RCC1 domain-containing protein, partial [bacterium]|nr:RCC1 domain-containing protein [bacterium]